MDWTFDVDGPVAADIQVAAGRIELAEAAGTPLRVLVEPLSGSRRAEELTRRTEVGLDGGRLRVLVPDQTFNPPPLLVRITLPAGSRVSATTASADLTAPLGLAAFEWSSASGDVELGDVTGNVRIRTASGDLRCGAVGGRLSVAGASADVRIDSTEAEADIQLASGDVRLARAEGSVRVRTASGDIAVERAAAGRVDLDSKSGDVRVGVAAGTGARLDASSLSGKLVCDLPVEDGGTADATLEVVCHTLSGDVHIVGAG
ncbi:MAG TPA: DUF4097 family beta strand repeat-containing protein [Acidimicrobiales bacterium]|nr:DUF4097 family beta strand repeat-containing protein [Acidimicrobiales bacterium]